MHECPPLPRNEQDDAQAAFDAAIEAGERAHLLTVGSPARGLALRATIGRLDRRGKFHRWQPDVFWLWRGIRYELHELRGRATEGTWTWLADRLPRSLAYYATIRVGVEATTGRYGSTIVPELPFMEALQRWTLRGRPTPAAAEYTLTARDLAPHLFAVMTANPADGRATPGERRWEDLDTVARGAWIDDAALILRDHDEAPA